jgi:hypothetical protein
VATALFELIKVIKNIDHNPANLLPWPYSNLSQVLCYV